MFTLEKIFINLLWRSKINQLALIGVMILIGLIAQNAYQQFLFSQSQNVSGLSVFNTIFFPLIGLTFICQLLLGILASAQLQPKFFAKGQQSIFQLAKMSSLKKLSVLLNVIVVFSCLPILIFISISLMLSFYSDLELLRLCAVIFGLLALQVNACLFLVLIHNRRKNMLSAMVVAVCVFVLLAAIDVFSVSLVQHNDFNFRLKGFVTSLLDLRIGLVNFSDLVAYIAWFVLLFASGLLVLDNSSKHNRLHLAKAGINRKCFLLVVFVSSSLILGLCFVDYSYDLTNKKTNSLSNKLTQHLIEANENLQITAVINDKSNQDEILRGFNLIKQVLPKTELKFSSKQSLAPEQQNRNQYLQFKLGNVEQSVVYPFNQTVKHVFETVLWQMLSREQQWVTFIEGHGEASPFSTKPNGLSQFSETLKQMGWPVAAQNLSQMPLISDNTGLLVIASSKNEWQQKEIDLLLEYLNKGRNLLLLLDPKNQLPKEIVDFIGVETVSGTLVDWQGYQRSTPHPAIVIIQPNNQHAVTVNLQQVLAFPWSLGLKTVTEKNSTHKTVEPILQTNNSVWNEQNIELEQLTLDSKLGEKQQSYSLAYSHTNLLSGQKIIVVGDSHFASNTAINNYDNKQFSLNLVSWLTNIKASQVTHENVDHSIQPSQLLAFFMQCFFTLIMPSSILLFSLWSVTRRKKQWQG